MDLSSIVVALSGIAAGIVAGLLPGLPAWIMPMLIIPTIPNIDPTHVIIFWLVTMISSQFFGSIASIMFRVPGEQSSMVYLDDIRSSTLSQRKELIKLTANAGAIATMISLSLVLAGKNLFLSMLPLLGTTNATFLLLYSIAVLSIVTARHSGISLLLFCIGAVLSPKSSIDLPEFFLDVNNITYDLSTILLLVGMIILPRLIVQESSDRSDVIVALPKIKSSNRLAYFYGSAVGMICGLLPGATATMSSVVAYKTTPGDIWQRIISSEAANNSAVVLGAFLLIYLQIPLNLDAIVVNHIFSTQGWDFVTDFVSQNKLAHVMTIVFVSTLVIWLLAMRSNGIFAWLCQRVDSKLLIISVTLIMLGIDIFYSYNSYDILGYLCWLAATLTAGIYCLRKNWVVFPCILGYLLGDQMLWVTWQMIGKL